MLSVSHITGVTPRREKNVTMFLAETNIGHKLCQPGDLVVNTMWAWMSALGIARQSGMVSPAYGVYRPLTASELTPEYADLLLRTDAYRAEYNVRSTGVNSSRMRLYPDQLLTIPIICPPSDEQVAITRFLGHLDKRMRRFIRAKQMLIKLLEEQKQAVIHRAVTHGLDPSAGLKPSGVKWLGDVPQDWQVKRLKWVTRLQRGYDLPSDIRVPGPYPVVSSGGVIDTHCEARSHGPGVVLGRYGSTDAVFFVEDDFWPHNTSLFVTNFHGNRPRWCYYMLRTISKQDHAGKSAVPGVDRKDLFQIMVAVPPIPAQDGLVAGIDMATAHIDRVIASTHREISLLREYRARLVADVVTGKLDVREVAATMPDEDEGLPLALVDELTESVGDELELGIEDVMEKEVNV
jgi:type I restriction enzyme S subunit